MARRNEREADAKRNDKNNQAMEETLSADYDAEFADEALSATERNNKKATNDNNDCRE